MPDAGTLPAPKKVIDPAPRTVLDWHVPPWHTGTDPKPYAVDQLPPRPDWRSPRLRPRWQQRLQRRPLPVREISSRHEL